MGGSVPAPMEIRSLVDRAFGDLGNERAHLEGMRAVRELRRELDAAEAKWVARARLYDLSWDAIGQALGQPRNTVHRHYRNAYL